MSTLPNSDYDLGKTRNLILYICSRCDMLRYWGRIKLFKILFYSDFRAYRELGHSITGLDYHKLPQGPVPVAAYRLLEDMAVKGELKELSRKVIDYEQIRPTALVDADLSGLSADEIAIVEQEIQRIGPMTADQVSKLSHDHPGWKYAEPDEIIPYVTAFSTPRKPTKGELEYALQFIKD